MSTTKKSNYNESIKNSMLKYQKAHIQQVKFNFHKDNDADILAFLDALPNKLGYIKALIRADMARAKSEPTQPAQNISKEDEPMKTYHIKPEHLSEWGDQTTEDTVVTFAEVVDLAREWDTTVDELLDQLEEI